MGSRPTRGSSFLLGKVTALVCFRLVVCLTLLAYFFLPSASLINMHMYINMYNVHAHIQVHTCMYTCVPPVVELAEAGASSALGIQLYSWHSQPHETCEQTLLHVGVLLERHVLHHWGKLGKCEGGGGRGDGRGGGGGGREEGKRGGGEGDTSEGINTEVILNKQNVSKTLTDLVVVPYHYHPLQLVVAVLWILQGIRQDWTINE